VLISMTARRAPPRPLVDRPAARARPAGRTRALVVLVLVLACVSCRGGCRRAEPPVPPLGGRLALFPVETRTVVSLDFAQVRASPLSTKLSALAVGSRADEQRLETFRQRTGLDPIHDIDSVTVAFPSEARARGELGVILRASHFDQARLVSYVRDALQKDGDDLVPTTRGRRLLWAARKDPTLGGFFVDDRTLVIGGGGWAARMADLADRAPGAAVPVGPLADGGVSAESDHELLELCEKAAPGHAIWAAAIVPPDLRRQLEHDPRFAGASAVMRMSLGIDLGGGGADGVGVAGPGRGAAPAAVDRGVASVPADAAARLDAGDDAAGAATAGDLGPPLSLDIVFRAELADAREAAALVGKVNDTLREAKRDPRVLMLGLGPDLDGITSRADGTTFSVHLALGNAQVADLLQRAAALLALTRQGRAPGF